MQRPFLILTILAMAASASLALFLSPWAWIAFGLIAFIFVLGLQDLYQARQSIRRVFPILGRTRYVMEWFRPKVHQYFVETDVDGRPLSRVHRSVIYQRAKGVRDTVPFGTQLRVYDTGYEWIHHSILAKDPHALDHHPKVRVGGSECLQPYDLSLLNVSAMSYGSLSKAAIQALNGGAKLGSFAHNTGEGGISPYHLEEGGDLIFQFGTGYFGCRDEQGNFNAERFADLVAHPSVKMIELKLSQGAKPGHGGILPAIKNTPEIAKIRGLKPGIQVNSPPAHKAFDSPKGLLEFIQQLRELSKGKPVGFKLCVGRRTEFIGICKAMLELNIKPDFISVDGAEGGTGAAPQEFSDSVGMPFKEGLAFVDDALRGFGLRDEIKLLASGKILNGFHIFRALALGADACYSARAMMLALGCIQALECNHNTCPTGVATQDPQRVRGLVVADKKERVKQFHENTVEAFVELLAACGLNDHTRLHRRHVFRRISPMEIKRFDQLYPLVEDRQFLSDYDGTNVLSEDWVQLLREANVEDFEAILT